MLEVLCVCFLIYHFFKTFFFWLCWLFIAVHGLSLVAVSRGSSSAQYSSCGAWAAHWVASFVAEPGLQSMWALIVVVYRLGCPTACRLFLEQVSNPCPLLWHAQSCLTLQTHGLQHARLLLSMGFSWQGYWCGLPFPPPGDLPNLGIEPVSPALADRFFTTEPPGKSHTDSF